MSRLTRLLGAASLGIAMTAAIASASPGGERQQVRTGGSANAAHAAGGRVIVKLRDRSTILSASTSGGVRLGPQAAGQLSQRLGVALTDGRILGTRTQVLLSSTTDSATLATALAADSEVEWAVVDQRRRVLTAPNDPLYSNNLPAPTTPTSGQWYLRAPDATVKSGVDIETAWAITTGSSSIVIADIDTGYTEHPDLDSKLLTPGYDFISDPCSDNETGRNNPSCTSNTDKAGQISPYPDASDPGDWVTAAENSTANGPFFGCNDNGSGKAVPANSSWHGTQTAGVLGAATNNGMGMAGTGYNLQVLPVRVLGKCGGWDSDIIAGAQWAAGMSVSGVPANPHPARVLNMSLGSAGACSSAYQDALTAIRNLGVLTVVAAGNDSLAVGAPANCKPAAGDSDQTPIVVAVTALRHTGTKVGFADLGPEVTIAAPGGNCVNDTVTNPNEPCIYPILSTTNSGTQGPVTNGGTYTTSFGAYGVGTSFSTPIVSGTSGLMLSANPALTNAQVIAMLQGTATTFPTTSDSANVPTCVNPATLPAKQVQDECICTTTTCGAGMLNAGLAVTAAVSPTAVIKAATTVDAGSSIALDGSTSTAVTPASISSYQWAITAGSSLATLSSATGSSVNLAATAQGTVTVQLTVTDSNGRSSNTSTNITVNPESSGGGGGGGASPWWLLALASSVLLLAPRSRRGKSRAH